MSSEAERNEIARGRLLAVWPQKCVFVVEEILKTEQDYVVSLRQIIEGYLKPLHSHLFEHAESPLSIAAVFGNITQLYEFNSTLERELETSQADPVAFGQVFVNNRGKFMYYSEYCTNYKSAVKYLEQLIDNNPKLGAFIAQCQKDLHHSFSLHDRLLKPVQRILKYHLLLDNLLRPLSSDHCGYASISEAKASMDEVADHINKVVKVQEVYSALHHNKATVPLKKMTSDRELIHEGTCRIGRSQEIELVLFQKLLLFFRKELDGSYNYVDHIMASELQIEEDPKNQKCFTINSTKQPLKRYSLQVQSSDDRQVWTSKIGVMQTGAWQDTIALERKKTVQNLSRQKLQASRRQPIQTCKQNRLHAMQSVPGDRNSLTEGQQPQDRTLSTTGLHRSKAVRLRKVMSSDCTSPTNSWLTSYHRQTVSPSRSTSPMHTSHILQTALPNQDESISGSSPPTNNVHVAITVSVAEDNTTLHAANNAASLSDNTEPDEQLDMLSQLSDGRSYSPLVDGSLSATSDDDAHLPFPCLTPSPDGLSPLLSFDDDPHSSRNDVSHPSSGHDEDTVEFHKLSASPCNDDSFLDKRLNGQHKTSTAVNHLPHDSEHSARLGHRTNQLGVPPLTQSSLSVSMETDDKFFKPKTHCVRSLQTEDTRTGLVVIKGDSPLDEVCLLISSKSHK